MSFSEPTVSTKSSQEMQILKLSSKSMARLCEGDPGVPKDRKVLREKEAWNEGKGPPFMREPRRPVEAVD